MSGMKQPRYYTNWAQATTSVSQAMLGLVSCLESGKNAWIDIRGNGSQDVPIKMKNPELDNPFNWTMEYSVPRNEEEMRNIQYFNDTEMDLTYNWIQGYGSQEAIEKYQDTGEITEGLLLERGIGHPVRVADANRYRKEITGDNYEYGFWVTYWKPKTGIPYWVVDPNVGEVFTICYNDEPVDKKLALQRAAQFLMDYAERL